MAHGLLEVGIFRLPGRQILIREMKTQFECGTPGYEDVPGYAGVRRGTRICRGTPGYEDMPGYAGVRRGMRICRVRRGTRICRGMPGYEDMPGY